jgi:hypothetical protein
MDEIERKFDRIDRQITAIKWMLGINQILVIAILIKVFR